MVFFSLHTVSSQTSTSVSFAWQFNTSLMQVSYRMLPSVSLQRLLGETLSSLGVPNLAAMPTADMGLTAFKSVITWSLLDTQLIDLDRKTVWNVKKKIEIRS